MSTHVFLTEVASFAEAQVVKSFLVAQGFQPRLRDEVTRSVAPHLETFLGKLIIEIPESEFLAASSALEQLESELVAKNADQDEALQIKNERLCESQDMAKKCLINAVLGCVLIPVICNLYSMLLGFRVLGKEMPLSQLTRTRLVMAFVFNCFGFYIWLKFGPMLLKNLF